MCSVKKDTSTIVTYFEIDPDSTGFMQHLHKWLVLGYLLFCTMCFAQCGLQYSQDFLVLPPAYSEAKGFLCDLQCASEGDGWVTAENFVDMLMGDLKPLVVGVVDLRERKETAQVAWVWPRF